jgi:ribonuclease BN (tRNA processing enzyme)
MNADSDLKSMERASIKLDIAIDEANGDECNRIVQCDEITQLFIKGEERNFREKWKNREIGLEVEDKKIVDGFWYDFFLAKRIRASIQLENKDEHYKKLDEVVDDLIKKGASKISRDDEKSVFQYLILMLELAECTVGEQSLGFSEKANKILITGSKHFPRWKDHCYKSLVHYNLGLAKQHMANYNGALREYDESLSEFKKAKKALAHDIEKESIDLGLWKQYVYDPTLLQKAEVLIKMQFSYNALTVLEDIHDNASIFHRRRRELLKLTCYIDLSDWHRFDLHWKAAIDCKKENSVFLGAGNKSIFQTSIPQKNGDLNFCNAKTPQTQVRGISITLISKYNSIVLDRAKEDLKKKKDIKLNNIKTLKIFDFINSLISQYKDNRFDKLTLEETILDYIEIIGKHINTKNKGFNKLSVDPIRKLLKKLIVILENNHFIDEIDSLQKPQVQADTVQKARKVLEDINDAFLKKWFPEEGKSPDVLPADVKVFFNFEKKLIQTLGSLKNRPFLLQKKYDKHSLNERETLLEIISQKRFSKNNIEELNDKLIIYNDPGNNKIHLQCLQKIINVIKGDQKHNDKHLFTLQFIDYDNILSREERHFHRHTSGRSLQPLPEIAPYSVNYVGLRRWNSYTPALSFSVGGGHFVFLSTNGKNNKGKVGIGIVVDPGFDFIRNFFRQGFTLTDIDIILLTHGHPDHIRDFPAVVELLYENKKRGNGQEKKIYAVMSIGCYERLDDHIVKDPFKLLFYDTIIVDIDKETENEGELLFIDREVNDEYSTSQRKTGKAYATAPDKTYEGVTLIPPDIPRPNDGNHITIGIHYFKAFHTDRSESDSYGYIIEFDNGSTNKVSIGFTGDSKWFPEYAKRFENCNIICSHIGSIAEPKKDKQLKTYTTVGKAERLMRTKGHPYLFGEILFWQDWMKIFGKNKKKTLMLMSEFGEEMKGKIRFDLAQRFNNPRNNKCCWNDEPITKECKDIADCGIGAKNMIVLPVDVGLRISIPLEKKEACTNEYPHKILCVVCDDFVEPDEIDFEVYSHEEAIFYVCKTCKRSTSLDVRHAIYQKYHEKGREIEKYDNTG